MGNTLFLLTFLVLRSKKYNFENPKMA